MTGTVTELITFLELFFPGELPVTQVFSIILALLTLYPLLKLHNHQATEPRQPRETGWKKSIRRLVQQAFRRKDGDLPLLEEDDFLQYADDIYNDIEAIYDILNIDFMANEPPTLFDDPPMVLCTARLDCILCPEGTTQFRSLRRRINPRTVKVLGTDLQWRSALVFAAHCRSCGADYYPDRITYRDHRDQRLQKLEQDAKYLRISKHGLYCSRDVARMQERAVKEFRAGWANFANFINDGLKSDPKLTYRQSQRLFIEHFSRRLLVAHGCIDTFSCAPESKASALAAAVRAVVGVNGGVIEHALHHGCLDCTHRKRYKADLIAEGATFTDAAHLMVEEDPIGRAMVLAEEAQPLPPNLPQSPPVQEAPTDGRRGYVRMVVMDGKTLGHRICAVTTCQEPLTNFKNGRFCETHLEMETICGIIPCGLPVYTLGALTCERADHQQWYQDWAARFGRLSYSGVRRVIRQERRSAENRTTAEPSGTLPQHRVQLPSLGDIAGQDVIHTFRAQTIYCIETVQYACGMPVGWGKCYRSESSPQVLAILNRIWGPGKEHLRPGFAGFDDACDLLRHIVTQNPNDPWITSTRFVVDAWHYIGHRATDVLCRLWCNPTPKNGSQPDLIRVEKDNNGDVHQTRAFNTETAEQFNAWLSGFEAPLRQMTDVNFDFFIHVLFLLYAETVQRRIEKKDRTLPDDFLAESDDD